MTNTQRFIWEAPPGRLPVALRPVVTALRIGHLILRDLLEGQLTLRSMGLVYTTLLAIVPLLALSFSVLKGFGVHNQLEPIMLNLFAPLGERGAEITHRIISFVDNIKVGILGSLGLALLIYTVISLLQKIERAFNFTWRVSEQRPWSQRFSDYLSVILIGPVLIFSALGITASVGNSAFFKGIVEIETIGVMVSLLSHLVPYILIILAFTFIYVFVPNTKVKLKSALLGGLIAGILWKTAGWAFAAFVVSSSKYTAIYSAFATLLLFMIWLYLSWLILLIGGSVAFYYQHPENRNLRSMALGLSNRMRERVCLLIMSLVGQHFLQRKPAWTLDGLSAKMRVDISIIHVLIADLVAADLLTPTTASPVTYVPAHALETIRLNEIIDAVRQTGESSALQPETLPDVAGIEALFIEMDTTLHAALGERSLYDLAVIRPEE
ncbi:MAG: YihY/virulence factor BrkB family protein [Gammaproteobacteria bacterium]